MPGENVVGRGNLRDFQLCELNLLKHYVAFCEEHQLKYYAMGGTLLGAVRHKGFIPWDDDIDVGMPREHYDRFIELCSSGDLSFAVHTFQNDPEHTRYFARIEDPSLQFLRTDMNPPELTPAWIDVFPLDGMPDGRVSLPLHEFSILMHRAFYRFAQSRDSVPSSTAGRPMIEKVLIRLQTLIPLHRLFKPEGQWKALDKCLRKYPYATSPNMINAMGHWKLKEMFPKESYSDGQEYDFEDMTINGPVDYDRICTQMYGDYMMPVNTSHHQPTEELIKIEG